MKKKAQMDSLVPVIATLIVVGLLLASGLLILQEFLDQDSFEESGSETGEQVTTTQYYAGHALDGASKYNARSFSVSSVVNSTNGATVNSSLYSITDTGTFSNATTASELTDYNWNVTYTYVYSTDTYRSVNDTIDAVNTAPSLLGLVILIIVVGIIFAIIFKVIPMGRVSGA